MTLYLQVDWRSPGLLLCPSWGYRRDFRNVRLWTWGGRRKSTCGQKVIRSLAKGSPEAVLRGRVTGKAGCLGSSIGPGCGWTRGGGCSFLVSRIRYSLRWNRLYLFTQHIEKNRYVQQWGCVDVSPTQNDYQQYNTQREKQVLGKWFNIGDRSKKPHHTITYITKISLTVSTTRLCSQWGQKGQKKLRSKQQKSKLLKFN